MSRPGKLLAVQSLIFLSAVILRLGLLERQGLWADEIFSLAIATGHSLEHPAAQANPVHGDYMEAALPLTASAYSAYLHHDDPPGGWSRVVRAVLLSDTNPPLYYLLLHTWTLWLGTTDACLRLFSVTWAVLGLPLIWLIGRDLGGQRTALIASTLFTFSPLSLYYATEGRMYAMLWFFVLSTAYLTVRLAGRGYRTTDVMLWISSSVGGLLTHYFFAFVWLACATWLLIYPRKFSWRAFAVAFFTTGLLILPWYLFLPQSLSAWRITQGWLKQGPWDYHPVAAFWSLVWSYFSTRRAWSSYSNRALLASFVVLAFGLFKSIPGRRFFEPKILVLWFWLLAALAGLFVFDLLQGTYTTVIPRYAISGMPAAFLLLAVGLGQLRKLTSFVFIALILTAWLSGIYGTYTDDSREREPFREVAAMLNARTSMSTLVLVHSIPSGVMALSRYLKQETPVVSWVGQLGQRRVPEDIITLVAGFTEVVLVKGHEVGEPAPEEEWLKEHAETAASFKKGRIKIAVFVPRVGGREPFVQNFR